LTVLIKTTLYCEDILHFLLALKALSHYCVWEKRMRSVWKLMT
jgi:hypothetical protein